MDDRQISELYAEDDSGECVSDRRGQWFELTEEYNHRSIFAS